MLHVWDLQRELSCSARLSGVANTPVKVKYITGVLVADANGSSQAQVDPCKSPRLEQEISCTFMLNAGED